MEKKASPKIVRGLNLDDPNLYSDANGATGQGNDIDISTLLRRSWEFQEKCKADANQLVSTYWHGYPKAHNLDLGKIAAQLASTPITHPWQIIYLIEEAGAVALELGMSKHKADIASKKNAAVRQWVQEKWNLHDHKKGNKSSFSKQYAELVRTTYDVTVTKETISRSWLKGM